MSKYTTEVRFICENEAGYDHSAGYSKVEEILAASWNKVFDFTFPIFDEEYRSVLCQKILKHYYTREIGFETVGLWKLKLNMLMNEIMPYYNKLYETELLRFNPLYDADYTKTHEGEDSGTGSETGTHTGTVDDDSTHTGTVADAHEHGGTVGDVGSHTGTVGDAGTHGGTITDAGSKDSTDSRVRNEQLSESTWDVYSDTPQGALTNVDQNTYLTNARKISHDSELDVTDEDEYSETNGNLRTFNETTGNTRTFNEGQSNTRTYDETNDNTRTYNEAQGNTRTFDEGTSTDKEYANTNQYVEHIVGKFPGKSYAYLIKEFRDTLLNIDVDIIGELSDLFIKLW